MRFSIKYRLNIHLLNGQIKYLECEKNGKSKKNHHIFRLLSHYCFSCTDTSQISREKTFLSKRRRKRRNKNFSASQNYCKWNKKRRNGGIIEERKFIGAQNLGQKIFHFIVCITWLNNDFNFYACTILKDEFCQDRHQKTRHLYKAPTFICCAPFSDLWPLLRL